MTDEDEPFFSQFEFDNEHLDRAEAMLNQATREKPVRSRDLNDVFDSPDRSGFPRNRALVDRILRERKVPVVSNNRGYWVATTLAELSDYERNINRRKAAMESRLAVIRSVLLARLTIYPGGA